LEKISFSLSNRQVDALYFRKDHTPGPAVILLHDIAGIVPVLKKTAELLVQQGYHVLLPDLYSHMGVAKYCVRQIFNEYARNNKVHNNESLNEILEIIDHFKSFPEVQSDNLGLMGQCLTGGFVLHAAIRPEIKAPVVFHHSFGQKGSGFPPGCAAMVQNTIQGHFVHIDPFTPKKRVKLLKEELGNKLQDYWYHLPHGIPHFFFNNEQGKQALERMMTFLREQLKPQQA
jgi:carboxymethylenebutenolidase